MSETLQLTGHIQHILKVDSGISKAGKEWQKREFVIETEGEYHRMVGFTLFNDKLSLLDGFKLGDLVIVSFNVESREFNSKWYHNINAYAINKIGGQEPETDSFEQERNKMYEPEEPNNEEDDLPF